MSTTDPISDLISRIRNAIRIRHATVDVPASRLKLEIVRILKEEGYIENYVQTGQGKGAAIRIHLRYGHQKKPVITTLARVSKPGCRVYAAKAEIPEILGGIGLCIISTPQGILTGKQAKARGLGGEVLCSVS